jgi:hypothetical protein
VWVLRLANMDTHVCELPVPSWREAQPHRWSLSLPLVGSRRAKLAPSYPSHFWEEGGAKRRVGAAHVNARNTSPAAPTPPRHIVRSAHDAPPSPRVGGIETTDAVALHAMMARVIRTRAYPYSPDKTPTPPRSRRAMRSSFANDEAHLKFRGRRECRALDAPAASHAK